MTARRAYMLRTCRADMTSYGDFVWPAEGPVEAPDWNPDPVCGGGLHGLAGGEGDGKLLDWSPDARWLVVEYDPDEAVDLGRKIKIPRGVVVHRGDQRSATTDIIARGARGPVVGATVTAGWYGTATAGYRGTAVAGDDGTARAGDDGTATAGYRGTAVAGNYGAARAGDDGTANAGNRGTAVAGDYGTATAGYGGTATAGHGGTATAGDGGTAVAGNYGTATAGLDGTATAGDYGTAIAGDRGTARAGKGGIIQIFWRPSWTARRRVLVGYVGEDDIQPNVAYRVRDGRLVAAEGGTP